MCFATATCFDKSVTSSGGLIRDDVINIAGVIKYILRTFKFGLGAPWG